MRICHWLVLLAALLCFACDQGGSPVEPAKPTRRPRPPLSVAAVGNPLTFNPIVANDPAARAVGGALFDTLVRVDPTTATARPHLAASWTAAADGTSYTLRLRDDVLWHDGEPFGADDVVFTVAAIQAIDESPYSDVLEVDGEAVMAAMVDQHTVRFELPRPYAPFLHSLIIPILPAHILGPEVTPTLAQAWGAATDLESIVGTGPFELVEYTPGARLELRRNPSYWRSDPQGNQLPYLDRCTIRIAGDRATALQWLLDGSIHIFNPRLDETAWLLERANPRLIVRPIGPDTSSLFLTLNRNPFHYRRNGNVDPRLTWFKDPAFTQAIAHAIDKQALIKGALEGRGEPAVSYLSPANWFYNTQLTDYVFDPAVARRILEDANYKDRNGDGIREDANKAPIAFTISTNEGNPIREKLAKMIADQLRAVGMDITLERLAFPTLFERLDATYAWDAMLIGFTGGIDPASSDNLLRSSGDLHVWHPSQQMPASAWEAQVDDLLDQANRELSPERRRDIYWHVQEILHKELPMIHIVRPTLYIAYRNDVVNFSPSPWGFQRIEELDLVDPATLDRATPPPSG